MGPQNFKNNTIWMYWTDADGGKGRPPYLNACLHTIKKNSESNVVLCGPDEAFQYLPELPKTFLSLIPAHQADIFRIGMVAKYGGMYLDADTIAKQSFRPLFSLLESYEYVGADWYPKAKDGIKAPISIGTIGPARQDVKFLTVSYFEQLERLKCVGLQRFSAGDYPFKWEELLRDIVVPNFLKFKPKSFLFNGARSWGAYVGTASWEGGDFGHMMMDVKDVTFPLPSSPFFMCCNSLIPDEVKYKSVEELLRSPILLAHLLKTAGCHSDCLF